MAMNEGVDIHMSSKCFGQLTETFGQISDAIAASGTLFLRPEFSGNGLVP
jgi:hypothetical protein